MTRWREGWVELLNGRHVLDRRERDDAQGREQMNRWALEQLERSSVVRVTVGGPTRAYIGIGGRGRR